MIDERSREIIRIIVRFFKRFYWQVKEQNKQIDQTKKLVRKFPFLKDYSRYIKNKSELICPNYEEYIKEVSNSIMTVSIETVVIMQVLCENLNPKRILDLGSGFSSYILRLYASAQSGVYVCSVDDNEEWLERTRNYLASHSLSTENMYIWDQFKEAKFQPFDFIFYDLGDMDLRQKEFLFVLKLVAKGKGILLLDDVHKESYSNFVSKILKQCICQYIEMKKYTLDELWRYSGIVTDVHRIDVS